MSKSITVYVSVCHSVTRHIAIKSKQQFSWKQLQQLYFFKLAGEQSASFQCFGKKQFGLLKEFFLQ